MKNASLEFEAALKEFMAKTEFIETLDLSVRRTGAAEASVLFGNAKRSFSGKSLSDAMQKITHWSANRDLLLRIDAKLARTVESEDRQFPFSNPNVHKILFHQVLTSFTTGALQQALYHLDQDWSGFGVGEIEYYLSLDPNLLELRNEKGQTVWLIIPQGCKIAEKGK